MIIEITFKDGDKVTYVPEEYTEYRYDGRCFIVIRGERWIGIYNLDCICCVEIEPFSED